MDGESRREFARHMDEVSKLTIQYLAEPDAPSRLDKLEPLKEKIIHECDEAIKLDNKECSPYMGKVFISQLSGDFDATLKFATEGIENNNSCLGTLKDFLIDGYLRTGQNRKALELLNTIEIKTFEPNSVAQYEMQRVADLKKAINDNPDGNFSGFHYMPSLVDNKK
jgi:hypothetical protein